MGKQKVILIGDSSVGEGYIFSMNLHDTGQEIGIIDTNSDKSECSVMDLPRAFRRHIYTATYTDCHDADIIVIAAGVCHRPNEKVVHQANRNVRIVKDIVSKVMRNGFKGIFLVATNPVDIISYSVYKYSGLSKRHIIGTGTMLESICLRQTLSDIFEIDGRNVHGYFLGEHGNSAFPAWSCTQIGGMPIEHWLSHAQGTDIDLKAISDSIKDTARRVAKRKGYSSYRGSEVLSRITQAILNDENIILPVSAYVEGEYGVDGIFIGVPAVINKNGLKKIITIPLNMSETEKMLLSEKCIRKLLFHIEHLIPEDCDLMPFQFFSKMKN